MPTAQRRRTEAAKAAAAKAKPKPAAKPQAAPVAPPAPPIDPPAAVEPDVPEAAEGESQVPEVAPFASMRESPPFQHATDRHRRHGPFELQMPDGEVIAAVWGCYTTTSGGWAWAWIVDGAGERRLPFTAPAGWRDAP